MASELEDFVNGFTTGYKLIKGPREKEKEDREEARKEASERRAQEGFERTGEWRAEDNAFRDQQAAKSDYRWETGRADQQQRYAIGDARYDDTTTYNRNRDISSDKWRDQVYEDQQERYGRQDERAIQSDAREAERLGLARDALRLEQAQSPDAQTTNSIGGFLDRTLGGTSGAIPEAYGGSDGEATVQPMNYSPDDQGGGAIGAVNAMGGGGGRRSYQPEFLNAFASGGAKARADSFGGLNASFGNALAALVDDAPPEIKRQIKINSAYRSPETQERLFRDAVKKYGSVAAARKWVAPPGGSQHNHGTAADMGMRSAPKEVQQYLHENAQKYGLHFPMKHEPWHIELVGARKPRKKAVQAALGGMIEEPDEDYEDMAEQEEDIESLEMADAGGATGAIPEDVPAPTSRPQYQGAIADDTDEPVTSEGNEDLSALSPYERGRIATREGLKRAIADMGAAQGSAIADPELEAQRQNYLKGYGAAPKQMMKQVMDRIDPERKMQPGERNMKAIGLVYQYHMDQGDVEKAQAAAAQMTQFYRLEASKFMSLAQVAAESGDTDQAAKLAEHAFDNIPNGRDISVTKVEGGYQIEMKDAQSGKTVHREVMNPQKMAETAMGFGPGTFNQAILDAQGAPATQYEGATVTDTAKAGEGAMAYTSELEGGDMTSEQIAAVGDIATDIATMQVDGKVVNRMTGDAAARTVAKLLDPNSGLEFEVNPIRGNPDLVEVRMNDDRSLVMSKGSASQLQQMVRMGQAAIEQAEADQKASDEKWRGRMETLGSMRDALQKALSGDPGGKTGAASEAGKTIGSMVEPAPEGYVPRESTPAERGIPDGTNDVEIERLMQRREAILNGGSANSYAAKQAIKDIDRQLMSLQQ